MDFLAKPVEPDHLLLMVERAIAQRRMLTEYILLKEELAERRGAPRIIGDDPTAAAGVAAAAPRRGDRRDGAARRRERDRQGAVRARACTRSVRGPTGRSWRSTARPFRTRCSRPSSSATRRARSPAPSARKPGRFELAHRGTLFLDEIGESAAGAAGEDPAGARGEAVRARRRHRSRCTSTYAWWPPPTATSRRASPSACSARISTSACPSFPSTVPPLRERPGDIVILARHFVDRFCRDLNKKTLIALAGSARRAATPTRGLVTCASCRTASSAPSSSATTTRLSRAI